MAHQYKNYPVAVMIAIDQLGNALTGGNPDSTISARVGYFAEKAKKTIHFWRGLEAIINFSFSPVDGPDHCRQAWQSDIDGQFRRGNDIMLVALSVIVFFVCLVIAVVLRILLVFKRSWRFNP